MARKETATSPSTPARSWPTTSARRSRSCSPPRATSRSQKKASCPPPRRGCGPSPPAFESASNRSTEESAMRPLDILAAILLVVGGLNWGLVALANFDLVATLTGAGAFGNKNVLGVVIYSLVGLAAVYQALGWKAIQRRWQSA